MTNKTTILAEFAKHPALKFANDAIMLQAIRSGTSGYTGKENLTEWLSGAIDSLLKSVEEKCEKMERDDPWANGFNLDMTAGYNQCANDLKSSIKSLYE